MRDIIETKSQSILGKYPKLIFSVVTFCFVSSVFLFNLSNSDSQSQDIYTVSVTQQPSVARGNGKVIAKYNRVLSSSETGFVENVFVKQGQFVEAGDLLIQLNNPTLYREFKESEFQANDKIADINFQHNQLEIELVTLRSDLAKAESILKGLTLELIATKKLKESGIVSAVKFEQLRLTVEQAEMDVDDLKLRLSLLEPNVIQQQQALLARKQAALDKVKYFKQRLDSLSITAPIDGVIRELPLSQGESVVEGKKLLDIVDNSKLLAEISIPQYLGGKVTETLNATIETPSGTIPGQVEFVDPIVRQGAIMVRIALPETLPKWVNLEQSVQATIDTALSIDVATVSRPDFYSEGQGWEIYQVVDGKSYKTSIKVLSSDEETLFLASGLQDGDEIVFVAIDEPNTIFN